MQTFSVKTPQRECLLEITDEVSRFVEGSRVREGVCTVFVPHTTAGVTINENADPDVCRDILAFLSESIPRSWPYRHVEGNSDAHIKASFVGASVQVLVASGRLVLGTWQGIYFAEFDGPRSRKVHAVVHGD